VIFSIFFFIVSFNHGCIVFGPDGSLLSSTNVSLFVELDLINRFHKVIFVGAAIQDDDAPDELVWILLIFFMSIGSNSPFLTLISTMYSESVFKPTDVPA